MREACCEHAYTMQAIAEFANLDHSTVRKLIELVEKDLQIKPFLSCCNGGP